jgi:hypothetical protein
MATLGMGENRISGRSRRSSAGATVRIVATNLRYGDLCRGTVERLPSASRAKLNLLTFQNWTEVQIPPTPRTTVPTIFVSRLCDIVAESAKKSRESRAGKHLLFSEGMPIEAVASRLPRLDIRDAHRVHVAREGDAKSISAIMYRLFSALVESKAAQSIVDAWVEKEYLVLLSPGFERLSVPLEKLAKLIGKNRQEIRGFEIDEDGRFLFWPHADVHLGWEQMHQLLDPAASLAAREKSGAFNRSYGLAIRSLRDEKGLKQAAIGGLNERHLRRIEQGTQSVTSSALQALAKAHSMPVEDYMKALAQRIGQEKAT